MLTVYLQAEKQNPSYDQKLSNSRARGQGFKTGPPKLWRWRRIRKVWGPNVMDRSNLLSPPFSSSSFCVCLCVR